MALLKLENCELSYEPYPIGVITPVFDGGHYGELLRTYPPFELFEVLQRFDKKFSLSEKHNPKQYQQFVHSHPRWKELHDYIKSDEFIYGVIELLRERGVDLGIRRPKQTLGAWLRRAVKGGKAEISSRFEFSILSANGGGVTPHTDAAKKFITVVFTMTNEGDWNHEWGGGTDILKTKDPALSFNFMNRTLPYEATETLRTVEFNPNQAMLFVKTFNSLHGVRDMTGPEGVLRKTLTVNIEHA